MRVMDETFLHGISGVRKYDLSPCCPGFVGLDPKTGYAATTTITQNLLGLDKGSQGSGDEFENI